MTHVQIEVHKGMADVTRLPRGVEVEIVDIDAKEVIVYGRKGEVIESRALTDEEVQKHR